MSHSVLLKLVAPRQWTNTAEEVSLALIVVETWETFELPEQSSLLVALGLWEKLLENFMYLQLENNNIGNIKAISFGE